MQAYPVRPEALVGHEVEPVVEHVLLRDGQYAAGIRAGVKRAPVVAVVGEAAVVAEVPTVVRPQERVAVPADAAAAGVGEAR